MTIEILFWNSNWVGKCYFDIRNPILKCKLSRKTVFCHSKSYFDIRTESENAIWILKILFWHTNWVGKSYFDIQKILFWYSNWVGKCNFDIQNPILTFEPSRKIVFWPKNPILTFELSLKMLFWHSKSYFDIRTELESRILTVKILFWHSNWVGKFYFDIQNPILTFGLSRKM